MPIRFRLLLAFGVVLALAVIVTLAGIGAISHAGSLVVQLYDEPFMAVSHARAAQAKFNEARAVMERAILFQDAANQRNVDALETTMRGLFQDLQIVDERLGPEEAHAILIRKAKDLADDWLKSGLKIIKPQPGGLTEVPLFTRVIDSSPAVSAAIDEVVEAASASGFQFRTEAETAVARSRLNLITLAVLTGMIALVLSFATAYSFIGPIRLAMAFSERIASGDFSQQVQVNRRDEFGRLLRSLGTMQEALRSQGEHQQSEAEKKERDLTFQTQRRESLEQEVSKFRVAIEQVLREVNEATTLLNETARTLSAVAGEADQQINNAASAAGETSQSVSAVAAASAQLSGSFQAVVRRITDTNEVIADASKTAAGAVNTIEGLSEATHHIEAVVALIHEIAEQTNLLALNATIEAARAGEAGRGFSVVASEVKTLASQTGKATQEISTKISDVRSATMRSVDAITMISSVMSEIRELTSGIAATVEEQSVSTTEMHANVKNAALATEDVARNIRGTANSTTVTRRSASDLLAAAETLSWQASSLRGSVDTFLKNVAAA